MLNRLADMGLVIGPAAVRDLDEVLAIEALCFRAPWSITAFEAELHNAFSRFVCARASAPGGGGPGTLAGFAIYWLVEDELHLINFGVRPEMRRRGIARAMMEYILADGAAARSRIATLEVRTGNAAAIALYRGFGFVPIHVRPKYYVDNDEDALVMMLELTHSQ